MKYDAVTAIFYIFIIVLTESLRNYAYNRIGLCIYFINHGRQGNFKNGDILQESGAVIERFFVRISQCFAV